MRSILLSFAVVMLCTAAAFSQDDSTRYIFGIPVDANDTVPDFPDVDFEPVNDLRPVAPYALPVEVREALKDPLYAGWQDSTIYFQKNTGLYLVPVKYEHGIKTFGLTAHGKPVTYEDVAR